MLKNYALWLVCLMFISVSSFAETRQVVLLLHEGTGRTFEFDQLQEAVNAAVAGDTICLNEGNYSFPDNKLLIDKPVSIIGTGQSTHLLGFIDISIPDSVTLKSHLLEALWVYNNVDVKQPVNGLKFRKVKFGGFIAWSATARDVELDRCYIETFHNAPKLKSANVINSIIRTQEMRELTSKGNSVTFINCLIGYMEWLDTSEKNYSKYVNCIINNIDQYWRNERISPVECYNTLVGESAYLPYIGIKENCYYIVDGSTTARDICIDISQPNGCTLTEEQLLEAGYLGDDGKVVGVEGGMTPYTLIPNGISVKKSKLEIDGEKRELKVTLQLQAQ